ncbi:hypothetical protein BDZ94DRAFT_595361 [Collybia nuda]|uniref:Uncharacterized protein n=1 Tax=Collybia nuda TaxID=64659 RepID=A0A9P5Y9C0_9AGAR|nr:hypothetical protein BDZ94DRAFT_595361 [Collybia nuda]
MSPEAASPSVTTLSSHHTSSSSSAIQSFHHPSLSSPYESFYAGHTHDSSISSARDLQLSFMREEIDGLRMKNHVLETEVIVWKTRFESTQEAIKMFQDGAGSVMLPNNNSNSLPAIKTIPPPLSQLLFTKVKFWTARDYDLECKKLAGETNGLATRMKKRGRPSRADSDELDDDDKH